MEKVYVYIDEFGNTTLNLEKLGTFSHLIYTAICIKEANINRAREVLQQIQKQYNQGSPLKASKLFKNGNIEKRIQVLQDINKIDYVALSMVIDKSKLTGEGLKYKQVFIKYFQRVFLEKIGQNYHSYAVYMDMTGSNEFKTSLQGYIRRGFDLFNQNEYQLAEDFQEEPLIQLADVLANSVGRCYCQSHLDENAPKIIDCLKNKLSVDQFPYEKTIYFGHASSCSENDSEMMKIVLDKIQNYIESNDSTDKKDCVAILKHLLLIYRTNPSRVVPSSELVNAVRRLNIKYSQAYLREAIQKLRDSGIIISSPQGKNGYKIPNTITDISNFYNRMLQSVVPMLKRVKISNEQLKIKSTGKINLLETGGDFEILRKLTEQL